MWTFLQKNYNAVEMIESKTSKIICTMYISQETCKVSRNSDEVSMMSWDASRWTNGSTHEAHSAVNDSLDFKT